jgi:hypothetical protein
MKSLKGSALLMAVAMISTAGCESVALVGRDSVDPQTVASQEELRAEVVRLDPRAREIHVRSDRGGTQVVNYDNSSRVIYSGREFPVSELRVGDTIVMQVKRDRRGAAYADLIRIQEGFGQRGRLDDRRSDLGVRTLSGTVENVNSRAGVFDLRERSGDRVVVALPYNASRSEIDRLATLRTGDRVTIEGRFVGGDRFELETFL